MNVQQQQQEEEEEVLADIYLPGFECIACVWGGGGYGAFSSLSERVGPGSPLAAPCRKKAGLGALEKEGPPTPPLPTPPPPLQRNYPHPLTSLRFMSVLAE